MPNPYIKPEKRQPSKAYLVPALRKMVDDWRGEPDNPSYEGISETSRRLLEYWFLEDHQNPDGSPFKFYWCQREAMETLIYCYEVVKARDLIALARTFGRGQVPLYFDPSAELISRYVFKIATGSGKTWVMALAMVWSYFHSLKEKDSKLAKNFLLIAPNIIVLERLRTDFEDGKIFSNPAFIPPEWRHEWQLKTVIQEESIAGSTTGTLYLTNIHRLYEERKNRNTEVLPPEEALGKKPKLTEELTPEELIDRICQHKDLLILNDEAHHVHDPDLEWTKTINKIHSRLKEKFNDGIAAQLDFSATPKDQNGVLFKEIIVDYPVAQAIYDGIVKRPILGEVVKASEVSAEDASVRYRTWISAGIKRLAQYERRLKGSKKQPVLFIMAENTTAADEIYSYLETLPELKGKVLRIHTDLRGEVKKAELEKARKAAKEIDSENNPYKAIVSVLMLREGWDVRNVTVVVGLRSFSSKAKLLPEQTVGRGLRLMFPLGTGAEERVDVIGNRYFQEFVEELEKEEQMRFERTTLDKPPDIQSIYVVESKKEYDFAIPQLTPLLFRNTVKVGDLTLDKIPKRTIPLGEEEIDEKRKYIMRDALTKRYEGSQIFKIPFPNQWESVVSFYAKMILKDSRLPARFADLTPIVKEYIEKVLFGRRVEISQKEVSKRLSEPDARQTIFEVFKEAINKLTIEQKAVKEKEPPRMLSETSPFAWTGQVVEADKTIFNLVPVDNNFEAEFARFLDEADDVVAFAKNTRYLHFSIEYFSERGLIRYYYPDFIVKARDGSMFIVETKGIEDLEVVRKDERARIWCKDASRTMGVEWNYVKVPERLYRSIPTRNFEEIYNLSKSREKNEY